MSVTVNTKRSSTEGRMRGIMPNAGLQAIIIDLAAAALSAGDYVVCMRLPFPVKLVSATYKGITDPAKTCTIDIGTGTYDDVAGTVTETDADFFVDGFDVNAAETALTNLVVANGDTYCTDEQDLIVKIATGTTVTFEGMLKLLVQP